MGKLIRMKTFLSKKMGKPGLTLPQLFKIHEKLTRILLQEAMNERR